jgi:L-amino acid N-acyltransferase YncA
MCAKPFILSARSSATRIVATSINRKINCAGSKLLEFAIETAKKRDVDDIYLHVQTSNEEAISFYKKFGFEIVETIKDYYKRIEPRDCYIVQKLIK